MERLDSHLRKLVGIRHHETAPGNLEDTADYIREQFRAFGLRVSEPVFEAFGYKNRNIIGRIEGSRRDSPVLILGAHYDSVSRSPGADDNASGLAVLLEAGRILSSHPSGFPILFIAFAQEEQGCLGSRAFVEDFVQSGQTLRGMIALECVGFATDEPGSQKPIPSIPIQFPDQGSFLGIVGNPEGAELIQEMEAAIKASGQAADKGPEEELPFISLQVPRSGKEFPDTRRSDHAPFWDAGFPALMLTDTANYRNPNYHLPGDCLETLNVAFIKKVAESVVALLKKDV